MTKPTIGFVGLGLMGAAMVERLQARGYRLTVLANRSRTAVDAAVARGASEVKTARDLALKSQIIMLCIDTSKSVEGRMLGNDGVIAGLRPGSVVIDFGTSLPGSTQALGEKVAAEGAQMLDAPLGRTPAHAVDGLLNIMASGDKDTFDMVKPVLDDLGENVFHLGPLGSGHTIKLINNFFAMTTANAMCEAFAIAELAGVAPSDLYDVMSAGPLRSGMMDFMKAYAIDGDPAMLAFAVKNASKDVGYYRQMTNGLGAQSIMSRSASEGLTQAVEAGRGDMMIAEMLDFYRQKYARS